MIDWTEFDQRLSKVPEGQRQALLMELIADHYRENFFDFCQRLLGYSDINMYTHGDIIRTLQACSPRNLIVMPRGTLKSTIVCVAWPHWLLCRNPNLRILIDSEVFTNSSKFLNEIKGNMESEKVTRIFGQFKSRDNWNKDEVTIKQRTRVFKEASITCGGIGTVKVGQHYDVIIGDDYNSPNNSSTPEKCMKIIDHYKLNTSILEPDGLMTIVATRYSDLDLVGHLLLNEIKMTGS